jgi:hypothetical protein
MKTSIGRCLLAIGLLLVATARPTSANLIVNGDFETGTFAGWTTTPAPVGSDFGVGPVPPACLRLTEQPRRPLLWQLQMRAHCSRDAYRLTTKLSDRHWQRASAEADDVVKPITYKLKRIAPVRCSALLGGDRTDSIVTLS